MKYANIKYCSTANGPGMRTSVYVSGCSIHCKGCFNSVAWDFDYGKEFTDETVEKILESVDQQYCSGITILGGEPLDPRNLCGVGMLIDRFNEMFGDDPDKTIWLYTGYCLENLSDEQMVVAEKCDVVVDGPFELDKADVNLTFMGSSNQRVISMK